MDPKCHEYIRYGMPLGLLRKDIYAHVASRKVLNALQEHRTWELWPEWGPIRHLPRNREYKMLTALLATFMALRKNDLGA